MLRRSMIGKGIFLLLLAASTALVLFATTQRLTKEQDIEHFAMAMLIVPALAFLLPFEGFRLRCIYALLAIGYLFIFYEMYVGYQNRPWFATPDATDCDGPCFGWYSFENQPHHGMLLLLGGVSLIGGMLPYTLFLGVKWAWSALTTTRAR